MILPSDTQTVLALPRTPQFAPLASRVHKARTLQNVLGLRKNTRTENKRKSEIFEQVEPNVFYMSE